MRAVPQLVYKYLTRLERFDYKDSKFSRATYQIKRGGKKDVQSELGAAKTHYLIREPRRNLKCIQEISCCALMFLKLDLSYLLFIHMPNVHVCE